MSINSLEKYISNRLTNHFMRTGHEKIVFSRQFVDALNLLFQSDFYITFQVIQVLKI